MRNLKLLHCVGGALPEKEQPCRFMAIDTLTPMIYLLCGNTVYGFDEARILKLTVDLLAVNALADDSETIVGMEYLADLQQICLCTSGGNILILDPVTIQVDTVACLPARLVTACWSPDFEILIVVADSENVFMVNRDFEIAHELVLHPAEFGTDDLITIGWGKKETQFHGSEGKQAATAKASVDTAVLDWDDRKCKISWRGDGQYFAVSAVDPMKGRTIRVWSREGIHCSTNEPVEGMGQCLAWRPSGSLIATSQTTADVSQVIFYERNGLRHGEFVLPFDAGSCQVKELAWNRESSILAVWMDSVHENRTYLQCYTTSNYYWYCKLAYDFALENGPSAICWDPDHANTLHVAFKDGRFVTYAFAFVVNRQSETDKSALVAVIDRKNLRLTDFRKAVVPPPMYQYSVAASSFVNEVTFLNETGTGIACLTNKNELLIFHAGEGKNGVNNGTVLFREATPKCVRLCINPKEVVYHLQHLKDGTFAYVSSNGWEWRLVVGEVDADGDKMEMKAVLPLTVGIFGLVALPGAKGQLALIQSADGSFSILTDFYQLSPCSSFFKTLPSIAYQVETVTVGGKLYVVCLNERFQLTVNGVEISNDVNSFCLHESFLLFTTITHHLKCLPFATLHNGVSSKLVVDAGVRNVERGSRIISAVSEDGKVVLQMPRGNLEAIYPRALILSIAKRMLDRLEYKQALLLMRRHRVNLNLLYDHAPKRFLETIDSFVAQINDSTLLNLFISDLKNEDVTETMFSQFYPERTANHATSKKAGKVDHVCNHLREAFRKTVPSHKFCTSILMTLVKMTPPQLDSALQVVKDFRDSGVDTKSIDETLQHLLYVIDANRLFDVALGTYDFDLVLMVAEKSQKDPKEFLPFLTELRSLESSYMKYKIDVHLGRWEKALSHLFDSFRGDSGRFDEFVQFVKAHSLYVQASRLLTSSTPEYKVISSAFADHLTSQRKYDEAAISYEQAGETEKAIESYTKALNWRMAVALTRKAGLDEGRMREICIELAKKLKDQRRFSEAALLEYEQLKDVSGCVVTLLEGAIWDEAVLRAYQSGHSDLIGSLVIPALVSSSQRIAEAIARHQATYVQYKNRLAAVRELKKTRLKEINEKGEIDDPMSEVSTEAGSTVTRSSAYSSRSAASRARRTKKQERKRYNLKEGNAYEDLGLLKELSEIVDQANKMQGDVANLLRSMAQFELQNEGQRLQKTLGEFMELIRTSMAEIWPETIDISMLPGPLEDQLADENTTAGDVANRFCGIVDSRLRIRIDPYMIAPKINFDTSWTVSWFS